MTAGAEGVRVDVRSGRSDGAGRVESFGDLIRDEGDTFRVSRRAYVDAAVFEAEMERIFSATWVFVGHTSEIPRPGSYKSTFLGLEPIIVSRGQDEGINVMYNRCRHRGAVVCREATGSANFFRCPYHGWVYAVDGALTGVAQRPGGYADTWEEPPGLQHVARVGVYRGMIFASMNPDVEPLEESLGPKVTRWIDEKFAMSPVGEIRLSSAPIVVHSRANWKFPIENILDHYHYLSVHTPFMKVQERYGNSTGDFGAHNAGGVAAQGTRMVNSELPFVTKNGHIVAFRALSEEDLDARLAGDHGEFYRALVEREGREKAAYIAKGGIAQLYPNVGIIHHQIRVIRPISVDTTEITIYPFDVVGAPDSYNAGWLHSQERFYGPTGYGMPDDYEMFELNQQGLQASELEWLLLDRGVTTDELLADGDRRGTVRAPETALRGQLRRWRELMTAEPGGNAR